MYVCMYVYVCMSLNIPTARQSIGRVLSSTALWLLFKDYINI